jgi:type I restriction enzyme S subunit
VLAAAFRGDLTAVWRQEQSSAAWRDVSIADVAAYVFDGPFGSHLKSADYTERGVRVVRLENIGHLQFVRDKESYIANESMWV